MPGRDALGAGAKSGALESKWKPICDWPVPGVFASVLKEVFEHAWQTGWQHFLLLISDHGS